MKRRKINPVFLVAGIMMIILGLVIFVPVLLGTASDAYNLEKYNGTGPLGNATPVMMSGLTGLFSMLSGAPLTMLAIITSVIIFVLVVVMILRNT